MAEYEKRLERLEERATIADDSGAEFMAEIRKRTAALLNSPEVLALGPSDLSEEELEARVEALKAATTLKVEQLMKRNNSPR